MKPVYLNSSIIIHELGACDRGRAAWYKAFGRKHVTQKIFLEAIQDRDTAEELMGYANWFANNILHSQYNSDYWAYYYEQCAIDERNWRSSRDAFYLSSDPDRGRIFREASDASTHHRNVSCLTKLVELYVAQESAP